MNNIGCAGPSPWAYEEDELFLDISSKLPRHTQSHHVSKPNKIAVPLGTIFPANIQTDRVRIRGDRQWRIKREQHRQKRISTEGSEKHAAKTINLAFEASNPYFKATFKKEVQPLQCSTGRKELKKEVTRECVSSMKFFERGVQGSGIQPLNKAKVDILTLLRHHTQKDSGHFLRRFKKWSESQGPEKSKTDNVSFLRVTRLH